MTFTPSFKVGDIVSNEQLYREFSCSNTGGIRPSNANHCVVLISDHTKALYDDKWYGNEFHYTGTGQDGDQSLENPRNRRIAESNDDGTAIYLFEVMEAKHYTFRGRMKLNGEPYQETQDDAYGRTRKVWMFPLIAMEEQSITKQELEEYVETRQDKARALSTSELKHRAQKRGSAASSSRSVTSTVYVRDEFVSEYAKRCANGVCELCEKDAPFRDKNGNPYLESHHIVWLSKGGSDTIDNAVALCPNCHKKMHVVAAYNDIEKLKAKARERARNA